MQRVLLFGPYANWHQDLICRHAAEYLVPPSYHEAVITKDMWVVFWLPKEAGPITYMELGRYANHHRLLVGLPESNPRRNDVHLFLTTWAPWAIIRHSLVEIAEDLKNEWM